MLYPKTCVFCGEVSEEDICKNCKEKIQYIREPRCKKCGKPIRYEEQEYCGDCQKHNFSYVQGKSLWVHKGRVPWSIYQFKYHNKRIYGEFYAKEMYRLYGKWIRERCIDVIVPVPLHAKRKRKRGYNQAEIIANYLSNYTNIPVDTNIVVRKKHTQPQKILGTRERRKNLKNAFVIGTAKYHNKRILLIDDIYTTGSTIDGLAKAFLEKGNNQSWFLTISIGQDF